MAKGYMGKILWVDLTKRRFKEEVIADEVYEHFLTGYGLGAKVVFDNQPAGVDPLGPDNILGLVSGLLTGTGASFAGRWMMVGKSPLTGGWGDANCGGNLAPAIKKAGYDGIFFTGQAKNPCYLVIDGGKKRLLSARDYWGKKDAIETEALLREKHGKKARVACIGSGGEQQSLISGVVNAKGRLSARSGLGAVMGSKKLKAIVLNGNKKVEVHNRKEVVALTRAFGRRLKRDEMVDKYFIRFVPALVGIIHGRIKTQLAMAGELFKFTLRKWGTSGLTAMSAENGDSPVKNWAGVGYRDYPIGTHSVRVADDAVIRYETKKYHCYSCPLGCGGICTVKHGRWPLEETHKPEYETLSSFGSLLLITDLPLIFKINDLLNRAGIDTISCGATVAWAFEAYERGVLTRDDVDGLDLEWGNGEAVLALVQKIIDGEGVGKLLKDGVKLAAERTGKHSDEFAIHAGGQELPMHDGRFDAGFGLHYEVEPTPGRHTIASYQYTDLQALHRKTRRVKGALPFHTGKDRYSIKGKGKTQAVHSNFADVMNGCGLCLFGVSIGGNPPVAEWLNAATGWRLTFDDYLEMGRRIKTLRHAFNLREGIKPSDTKMTPRARGVPPMLDGPSAGITPDLDGLAHDYYREMGWDPVTGKPSRVTLANLELKEVGEALEKAKK